MHDFYVCIINGKLAIGFNGFFFVGSIDKIAIYLGAIAAIVSAFFAGFSIWRQAEQQKTNLFYDIYKEEKALRLTLDPHKNPSPSPTDVKAYVNHFEVMAFFLNTGKIREDDFMKIYFPGALIIHDGLKQQGVLNGIDYKEFDDFMERKRSILGK